jgi:hypothetical protein
MGFRLLFLIYALGMVDGMGCTAGVGTDIREYWRTYRSSSLASAWLA